MEATATKKLTKSQIFKGWNASRKAIQKGIADEGRVNRALGYLQSGEAFTKWEEYGTSLAACGCPDHIYRASQVGPCKHRFSLWVFMMIIDYKAIKGDTTKGTEIYKQWLAS